MLGIAIQMQRNSREATTPQVLSLIMVRASDCFTIVSCVQNPDDGSGVSLQNAGLVSDRTVDITVFSASPETRLRLQSHL